MMKSSLLRAAVLLSLAAIATTATAQVRGENNAITDVPGITVGHRWRPDAQDDNAATEQQPTDAEVSLWTGVGVKP